METEAAATMSGSRPQTALYLIRVRSLTSKVLDLDDAASGPPTPPRRSPVGVPFLWEDAPGKPKIVREAAAGGVRPPSAPAAATTPLDPDGGGVGAIDGDRGNGARARPVPLKLPPRLQAAEYALSPNTVLRGPYGSIANGNKPARPLRRSESTTGCRVRAVAGGRLFSWRKATAATTGSMKHVHDHDASSCSPSSSSSSSSMSYLGDDYARGAHRRQAVGHGEPEDGEEGGTRSVRITRLRRNRSMPSLNASHLWASFRKSVRQITPWS